MFFRKRDTRNINQIADNIKQTNSLNDAIKVILGERSLKDLIGFEDGDAVLKEIRKKFDLSNSNEELKKEIEKSYIDSVVRNNKVIQDLIAEDAKLEKFVKEGMATRNTLPFDSKAYIMLSYTNKWIQFQNKELPKKLQDLKDEKQQELNNILLQFEKVVISVSEYSQLDMTPQNNFQRLKKLEIVRQNVRDLDKVMLSPSLSRSDGDGIEAIIEIGAFIGLGIGMGVGFVVAGPIGLVFGGLIGAAIGAAVMALGMYIYYLLDKSEAIDRASRDENGKAIKAPNRNINLDIFRDLNAEIVKVIKTEQEPLNEQTNFVTRAYIRAFA